MSSYIVIWGYKTGLMNKKFIGIKPCGNCGKFSEHYLAKSFFRVNLFWFLPIFGVPTGKYIRCGNCDGVRKLTRAEWIEMKENARFMPKKKEYLQAYDELKKLVIAASPEDLTTSIIYSRLQGKLDFTDDGGHIRELVDVYLKNSQNAASIAAKAAEGEPSRALVTEEGVTREVENTSAAINTPTVSAQDSVLAGADTEIDAASVQEIPSSITGAENNAPAAAAANSYENSFETPKKRSMLRLLWLIPALLVLPFAIIFLIAAISIFAESAGYSDADHISYIITAILFAGVPVGLDILFFWLAFKKKK